MRKANTVEDSIKRQKIEILESARNFLVEDFRREYEVLVQNHKDRAFTNGVIAGNDLTIRSINKLIAAEILEVGDHFIVEDDK